MNWVSQAQFHHFSWATYDTFHRSTFRFVRLDPFKPWKSENTSQSALQSADWRITPGFQLIFNSHVTWLMWYNVNVKFNLKKTWYRLNDRKRTWHESEWNKVNAIYSALIMLYFFGYKLLSFFIILHIINEIWIILYESYNMTHKLWVIILILGILLRCYTSNLDNLDRAAGLSGKGVLQRSQNREDRPRTDRTVMDHDSWTPD